MAYDEKLAERIRVALADEPNVTEKKMFGGLAFLLRGNMACGVTQDDLMLRVGIDHYEEALALPQARAMDFTGRPMKGFVFVAAEGCKTAKSLGQCLALARDYANTLPAKKASAKKAAKKSKR
jgi:TfoX/Sxy family transcriptional regulator of competence genes